MTTENCRKATIVKTPTLSNERNSPKEVNGAMVDTATTEQTSLLGSQRHIYIATIEGVTADFNIQEAISKVKANRGAPGIDNITTEEIDEVMKEQWPKIKKEILEGSYYPKPVRRVEIEKPDGSGMRKLGIPTVLDRIIQQAVLQEIIFVFEPTFSDSSFGFRPGRKAHQAVIKAREYLQEGYEWVVDIDLEKFFDMVNHDMLMARIARKVKDKKLLLLIRRFLQAGVMENGLTSFSDMGTPQGGPISPLLSNIMLDDFDKELERRGHRFCRYADDCNIYVKSEKAGKRVMESLTKYLTETLKLKVNLEKSAVDRPCNRKFLGFTFGKDRKTNQIKVHPSRIKRFKDGVRKLIKKCRGNKILEVIKKDVIPNVRGWINYFKLAYEPRVFPNLDAWIRRKIRCAYWEQWKTSKRRFKELMALGAKRKEARNIIASGKGAWRISRTYCMQSALGNKKLEMMGLIPLMTMMS